MNDLSTNKNNVEGIHNSLVQSQEKATKNAKNVKKGVNLAEKGIETRIRILLKSSVLSYQVKKLI